MTDIYEPISTIFLCICPSPTAPFILVFYTPLTSFFLYWFETIDYTYNILSYYISVHDRLYHSFHTFIEIKGKKSKTRQKSEESIKERTRDSDDILRSGAEMNSSKEEMECFHS